MLLSRIETDMNDPRQLFQHHESNVRSYCRAFDVLFVRGAGSELFDAQGRRYIDFEPPRVSRRPLGLSHADMADSWEWES